MFRSEKKLQGGGVLDTLLIMLVSWNSTHKQQITYHHDLWYQGWPHPQRPQSGTINDLRVWASMTGGSWHTSNHARELNFGTQVKNHCGVWGWHWLFSLGLGLEWCCYLGGVVQNLAKFLTSFALFNLKPFQRITSNFNKVHRFTDEFPVSWFCFLHFQLVCPWGVCLCFHLVPEYFIPWFEM